MREQLLDVVKEQYSACQVIDAERAIVIVPPEDGRYGKLALEVPVPRLPVSLCHDERAFHREIMAQMDGLMRALPDIGRQTLNALKLSEHTRGTIWGGVHLETFLRFGIMTEVGETVKQCCNEREALEIVPPQYATDVQVILRTRSNAELEVLIELIQQNGSYGFRGWTYSYERVHGYNHVFGVVGITQDMVEIRDRMEGYWQLVNGSWSDGREQRQYINNWLSGVDFR